MQARRTLGFVKRADKATQTDRKEVKTFKFSCSTASTASHYTINMVFLASQLYDCSHNSTAKPTSGGDDNFKFPPPCFNSTLSEIDDNIIVLDSSSEEDDAEGNPTEDGVDEIGEMDWSHCAVCMVAEPDNFLRCLHAFCETCLLTMKGLKTMNCPQCKKKFRKWYPLGSDDGLPKNRCRRCRHRNVDALLGCFHVFCKECLAEMKDNCSKPICPKPGCGTGFRKWRKLHY